jgi:hypothetical protein
MLDEYLKTLQGFIRDRSQKNINPEDAISYINRARREVALRTQCIRILTPISGQIESIQVTAPGSGYSAPVVTIPPPDFPSGAPPNPGGAQATALATQIGGQISNVSMTFGGDGYFQPIPSINDPTGRGATLIARITPLTVTQGFQEVYPFSGAAPALAQYPGVGEIFVVNSISFIYANYRYSLPVYSFTEYQAKIRQYPQQYLFVPTMAAQFGQGTNGSIYFYPIPSTIYQMEWDSFCLPTNLSDDYQLEPIAKPWDDAVPIGAAVYAYEEMQNLNAATYYQKKFDEYVHRYSAWARPGRTTNPYGRY